MSAAELVSRRRSVRTYEDVPLSARELEEVGSTFLLDQNPFGVPVRLQILDAKADGVSSRVIRGAHTYVAGALPRGPYMELAYGYSFQKVILRLVQQGFGTCWLAGTLDRDAFQKAIGLGEGEMMPAVTPVGREAARMSALERVMRQNLGADSRMDFATLFFGGDFSNPLDPGDLGSLAPAFEAVREAPSAVNHQPWRLVVESGATAVHFFERHDKHVERGEADVQKVDLGIAMLHFELVAREQGYEGTWEEADPHVALPDDLTEYVVTWRRA